MQFLTAVFKFISIKYTNGNLLMGVFFIMRFMCKSFLLVLCATFCNTTLSEPNQITKEQVESMLEVSFKPSAFGKEEEELILSGFSRLPIRLIKEINTGAKKNKTDTDLYQKGKAVCVRAYITNQNSFEKRLAGLVILT